MAHLIVDTEIVICQSKSQRAGVSHVLQHLVQRASPGGSQSTNLTTRVVEFARDTKTTRNDGGKQKETESNTFEWVACLS